jgi:Iron/zinc purple acid phosphatase-like protein C
MLSLTIGQTYGYGRVTIKNATALHFEFVEAWNEMDSASSGDVLDEVWIFRGR